MRSWVIRTLSIVILLIPMMGCARTEKIRAVESDKETPYVSLGSLEMKTKAYWVTPANTFWTGVEMMTLSFAHTPSRGELYKRKLRSDLASLAHKRYGADAVINVTYWPDPESARFPNGLVYARGEMIRYRRFPMSVSPSTEVMPQQ